MLNLDGLYTAASVTNLYRSVNVSKDWTRLHIKVSDDYVPSPPFNWFQQWFDELCKLNPHVTPEQLLAYLHGKDKCTL